MSSNLPLEAKLKYQDYLDAKNIDDRILHLQAFLSEVPKHKATEKIVALNKSRLAKLKIEKETIEARRKRLTSGHEDPFSIKKEPQSIQVIMLSDFFDHGQGVGKTTLLQNLTGLSGVKPGIFTPIPQIGIYDWRHVKFQLIEEPALHQWQYLSRALAGLRSADIVSLIIDLTKDPLQQMDNILKILSDNHIYLNREPPKVKIKRTSGGGFQIFFFSKAAKESEHLSEFIKEMGGAYGNRNVTVKIYEKITVGEIGMAFNPKSLYIPAIIIATKADLHSSKEGFAKLKQKYERSSSDSNSTSPERTPSGEKMPFFPIYPVAVKMDDKGELKRQGLENLGEEILQHLDMIQIFTKSKKGVAKIPLVLPRNGTIGDVAMKIHKDLFNTFKFAYIYRIPETGHVKTRIKAGLHFPIEEFDVIEIYSRI